MSLGSGDCDDYSILAAALFEGAGIESAIAFMKNDYDEGHVLVLVRLDDLTITNPYYDGLYFYWDDLTHYQLQSGRWIIIEPQVPIEYQGDSEWIEQWDLARAQLLGAIVYALIDPLYTVSKEERELREAFPLEFEEYSKRTPSWIPRIRK